MVFPGRMQTTHPESALSGAEASIPGGGPSEN